MYETINADNAVMYAIRHYDNPQCEGEKEFEDDLKRFKYIKRLLRKYYDTGILKEKLGRLGFAFGAIPEMTEKSGSFDLPLTKFGGRFGKDLDTPTDEFLNDDGISHMVEGGLALKIQYEMLSNSSCRIFAEIA